MSLVSDVLARGGGAFDLRVAIEGCPLEFCSAHAMAEVLGSGATEDGHDVEGVRRVGGLRRDGLSFQESCYLPGADYKASLGSVTIEDEDESVAWNTRAASSVFSAIPRAAAYLSATVTSAETTWSVLSTDGLAEGVVYHVDTEAVRVTAINSATEIEVERGVWRTTAQTHFRAASDVAGDRSLICAMWTSPPTYRRRRVWIYGHALDASTGLVDAGSLVARGIIGGAPTLSDGATWSFPLASLTSIFDSDIGPREGASAISGIYYPGAHPFRFTIYRRLGDSVTDEVDESATIYLAGFWRSQDEWCAALTAAIQANATVAGWDETITARATETGWELYVLMPSSTPKHIACWGGSVIDGMFTGGLHLLLAGVHLPVPIVSAGTEYRCSWASGEALPPGAGPRPPPSGVRGVPRAQSFVTDTSIVPGTAADIASYPWHRLYLTRATGIAAGDTIRVTQEPVETMAYAWEATVTAVDTVTGAVTWDPDTMRNVGEPIVPGRIVRFQTVVTPACMPTVSLVRDLGTGHVGDMLQALVADAPDLANAGAVPFLLSSDFDSFSTIDAAVREAASGRPWLLSRRFAYASSVRFSDVIKHELRLLGCFLSTTVSGAITIRPLVPRVDVDHTIAAADLMTSDGYGDLVVEPDGTITGLTVKTGYDSIEDEHKGQQYDVTALGALAAQRQYLALEIAPKSTPMGSEPTHEDLIAHLYGKVSLWSRIRFSVTVPVALWHYDALVGDAVYCTIPQLPYDGERGIDGGGGGVVALRGVVTGRSWRFAEPCVSLTILFDAITIAGYAPTGRITSQSGSATTWTLTLDADEYGPGGSVADASFFAVGYKIRLYEYNVDVPTTKSGTVTSVSGNDVGVELDASWTPGSSTWNIAFNRSTTSGIADAQLRYAYAARDDWRVHLASGTDDADTFTP